MSRCIDCKWAYLDHQERLTIKLQNKPQIFECMYTDNTIASECINYDEILLKTLDCYAFEPCT